MGPAASEVTVRQTWYAGGDSWAGELWTMLHLPYTLMVLSFVVVGAALAPTISWSILGWSLLAYFLGLGLGAHLLDQVPGMGTHYVRHWPTWALWTGGFVTLGGAVVIGVLGAVFVLGLPFLILVAVQSIFAIGYPLSRWFRGALHRDSVFAVSWGSLPFLVSYYAQSLTFTVLAVAVAIVFGAVAMAEIKLSRRSRRLRAEARDGTEPPAPAATSFHNLDRALMVLSFATILGGILILLARVALVGW